MVCHSGRFAPLPSSSSFQERSHALRRPPSLQTNLALPLGGPKSILGLALYLVYRGH